MTEDFGLSALAAMTRAHRVQITASVLAKAAPVVPTIGWHLRVEGLIDALALGSGNKDSESVLHYVQAAARRTNSELLPVDIFQNVWPAITSFVREEMPERIGSVQATLDILARESLKIMEESAATSSTHSHETFEETDALIETLITKLDICSPFTAEHSRAVSAWAVRIARCLGLSSDECTMARRGGLIHDIGKAATPADILEAPRALTETEWVVMRNHTTAGAAVLEAQNVLHNLIPAVRHHHERLDGKGYPDGLRARDISIIVRIVSVADCFNAMVGRRPYRAPMPPTRALEELMKHRGTQFDPDVVEAMTTILNA